MKSLERIKHGCQLLICAGFSVLLGGCLLIPIPYKGYPHRALRGQVVDAKTGRGIEGATVSYERFGTGAAETDFGGKYELIPEKRWNFPYNIPLININLFHGPSEISVRYFHPDHKLSVVSFDLGGKQFVNFNHFFTRRWLDLETVRMEPLDPESE